MLGGQFLTQMGMGSRVSQRLHLSASGQGQGPAGPRVGSGLLSADSVHRLLDCSFLVSGACPLVGGVGSWPSGGQGRA